MAPVSHPERALNERGEQGTVETVKVIADHKENPCAQQS